MPGRLLFLFFTFTCFVHATPIQRPAAIKNPHGDMKLACQQCHTTNTWVINPKNIQFDHAHTGFALLGAHTTQNCKNCHESLVFSNIGTACVDCHTDIHRGELGVECESCHNSVSWENRQEIFQQHLNTRFPLKGAHALTDCESCHFNQQRNTFKNTPVECNICHAEDYTATENPNHQEAGFPMDCQVCHRVNAFSWSETDFDHAFFPLTGAHLRTTCEACHADRFTGTPRECYACHKTEYDATLDPDHQLFGFQTTCESCHNTESWITTTFDHLGASGFELVGSHNTLQCSQCHINNQVTGLPRDCFGCHETDYRSTTDPNHAAANYPHDCTICHSQNVWQPADFDHNLTNFPLIGAHQTAPCADCHVNNIFVGTPTECYACHENDFNTVDDPNHAANNFDHDCTMCHTTSAWSPATFDHNITAFPLTGAHTSVSCADCHANGYANTPTDCYFCHQTEFDQTTDPNHRAAQFPQDCQTCHNTSNWNQTTFDHDNQYFPIYSGEHRGEWTTCADCHVNSSNYQVFECIYCHEHSQSRMDSEHNDVRDYQYKSTACYDCHPRGRADD